MIRFSGQEGGSKAYTTPTRSTIGPKSYNPMPVCGELALKPRQAGDIGLGSDCASGGGIVL